MATNLEAALAYASWGWHVIPVVPNGKIPATQHGVKDATIDPVRINQWWMQNPDYNIGIAAGERSGIIVFDIDPRNGGTDSWDIWLAQNGKADDGIMQLTAGGGEHHVAIYDPEIRSCKLGEGIDLLADGRYFVAYPSTIEGRSYQWEGSSDPFDGIAPFKVPEQWLSAYKERRKPAPSNPAHASGFIQGSRNNGLAALGGAMRRYGMTEAEIFAALSIANETRCEIPLPSSELSQIVRSVARYEPDSDLAADAGIGHEAAEALLSASQAESSEYFFTRASSFLDQPAPIRWLIKEWIPADGVTMIFGESRAGKTFITLSMACAIASETNWQGKRTLPGVIVYMAGEGNYGMRQRVSSWSKHNKTKNLDNLLISNQAIDVDNPQAPSLIIGAIKEITDEPIAAIFLDTVNNHMSGDENSAKDTRAMLNSCRIVAAATGAAVILNHHTGHSVDAKGRARGSSAWKGNLDSSIFISRSEDDIITIHCPKQKDAPEPEDIFGKLMPVNLGWKDEDGVEIVGAVFELTEDRPKEKVEKSSLKEHRKTFENAFWASGAEKRSELPYLSRSGLLDYLKNNMDWSEGTINAHVRPAGNPGRLIRTLLDAKYITPYNAEKGWVISDLEHSQAILLSMNNA